MEGRIFQVVRMFESDDPSPEPIAILSTYKHISIVVETFDIPPVGVGEEELDITGHEFVKEHFTEANFISFGVTGTVDLKLQPAGSFRQYDVDGGKVDLSNMHFLNVHEQIHKVHPVFENIIGCTHVAITITATL